MDPAALLPARRPISSCLCGSGPVAWDRQGGSRTRGRQLDATILELPHERRTNSGRLEPAFDLPVVEARLLIGEDFLRQDLVVLDPVDLGDADDLAGAILEAGGMDDQVNCRGDLLRIDRSGNL